LNKIIDQSSYTVIFNDGDEKTLKRNFVRFKGEKHFLDSETLNNAPLNNPEHFLYPIKQSNEQTNSLPVNQEESVLKCENDETLKDQSKLKSNDDKDKESKDDPINRDADTQKEEDEDVDDDESDESSDDSDEYTSEEKDRFVAKLYSFMDDRGTPMNKVPSLNNQDLDLHKFFMVVKKFGGFNKVWQ
jgi:TATA-binding protein-associated factor Taf7